MGMRCPQRCRKRSLRRMRLVGTIVIGLVAGAVSTHAQQRFDRPSVDGVRIDWCLTWGTDCGKPAADRFCRDRGLSHATRFDIARAVGPTRIIGSGQPCNDKRCDGFAFIECAARETPRISPDIRPVRPAAGERRDRPTTRMVPVLRATELNFSRPFAMTVLPSGARLWYWLGDIQTAMDVAAKGQRLTFNWNVAEIPGAQGVVWQINRSPFPQFRAGPPSVLNPPGLVASGREKRVDGAFNASFDSLPRPTVNAGPSVKSPRPIPWYVRVIPVNGADPPVVVGQPSNFVRVFDKELPPPPPNAAKLPPTTHRPGANITLLRFQYKPHWDEIRWPPGCRTEPEDKSFLEEAWEGLTDAWNGVTEGYAKMKSVVVDLASTLTGGYIPRSILETALTTALVAAGVPPDIPNLDQLMSEGADYLGAALAEQVIGPAADDVIAELAKKYNVNPNLGPEQLKQAVTAKARETTKKAVLDGAAAARRAASSDGPCLGRRHPAQITLTVRSLDPPGSRFSRIAIRHQADYVDDHVYQNTGVSVVLEPGETLTIPVPLLPRLPTKYNQSQLPSEDHARNMKLWWDMYRTKPARFIIESSGDETCYQKYDGDGEYCMPGSPRFTYTTPKWLMDKPFDDPKPQPGGK